MDDPVHDRNGHIVVVEELTPVGKVLVGGQDNRAVFIQAVDQLDRIISESAHRYLIENVLEPRPAGIPIVSRMRCTLPLIQLTSLPSAGWFFTARNQKTGSLYSRIASGLGGDLHVKETR